jgi:hypothetical protein
MLSPVTYFLDFLPLPVVIAAPGVYRTRGGEEVVVETCKGGLVGFNAHGKYPDGTPEKWHETGRIYFGVESSNDIVALVKEV